VISYRGFRNTDPPALAAIWNEVFPGRGAVKLRHSSPLENYVFSKPYFDPQGLVVAVEDSTPIGFAHAGFGPNQQWTALSFEAGVTCVVGVVPSHRRRGIGSELLQRSERYLQERGARVLYAGPLAPMDPFYFALYGGSGSPGILASEKSAPPFYERHGYQAHEGRLILQRGLSQALQIVDGRFSDHRRTYDLRIVPRLRASPWWEECALGPIEIVDFRLENKQTGQIAACLSVWEMDLFSWRWDQPSVGFLNIEVQEPLRRCGVAKYLLTQTLHYLQDQFFGLSEVHVKPEDSPALQLFRSVGFAPVDSGQQFKKTSSQ
jgi:ribosomal protein S18 acetylase RimI-like enzyme